MTHDLDRLLNVVEDDDHVELIVEYAKKAGLLWQCAFTGPDGACEWWNHDEATYCENCGEPRHPSMPGYEAGTCKECGVEVGPDDCLCGRCLSEGRT